jgi:hypothetical protein
LRRHRMRSCRPSPHAVWSYPLFRAAKDRKASIGK